MPLTWENAPHDVAWSTYRERSPDVPKLSRRLVALVDALDEHVRGKLVVHRTWDGAGTTGQHPQGTALDGHIEGVDILNQFLIVSRFPWGGLGLYGPDVWHHPGFHVDVRDALPQARWACRLRNGKREYVPLVAAYLRSLP